MENKTKDTLKNRVRYSSTFDKELFESFKELSLQTKIPVSKLFDEALTLLLEKYNKSN